MPVRRDLPQFLDADRVGLRVAAVAQLEPLDQPLRQRAAAALGEQRLARDQLDARRVAVGRLAVAADAHVAGRDAAHPAVGIVQHLGTGKPGIDLDPELLGLRRQPAAQIAEADDVVAAVVHLRRGRQPERPRLRQIQKPVLGGGRVERGAALAPVRDQFVERARFQHRARQDMRADLRALLDDADADLGLGRRRELLQPDRRREPRRPGPDDDHVILHPLALDLRLLRHRVPSCRLTSPVAADYKGLQENPNSRDAAPSWYPAADVWHDTAARGGSGAARMADRDGRRRGDRRGRVRLAGSARGP